MANGVTNLTLQSNAVRTELQKTEEGRKFLELWPTISTVADIATLTTFVASTKAIARNIDGLPLLERQTVKRQIARAEDIIKYRPSWKPDLVIEANPNKTTTIIGKWRETNIKYGTNKIISELESEGTRHFNVYSKYGKTSNNGGFNLLNEDLPNLTKEQIWTEYNELWLREALERGDNFYLVSDPLKADGFYLQEIEYIKANASKYGYSFEEGIKTGKLVRGGIK